MGFTEKLVVGRFSGKVMLSGKATLDCICDTALDLNSVVKSLLCSITTYIFTDISYKTKKQ